MEGTSLGIVIAFTAGLLSFLSPCVLPLIPSYVTFITGLSLEDVQKARRAALVHSLPVRARLHADLPRARCHGDRARAVAACSTGVDQPHRRRPDHRLRTVHARRVQRFVVLAGAPRTHREQASRIPRHAARGNRVRRGLDAVHRADPRIDTHVRRQLRRPGARLWLLLAYSLASRCRFSCQRWRWSGSSTSSGA